MNFHRKSALLFAVVATVITAFQGCASPAVKAAKYEAPPLGTSWVTSRRDTGSFGTASTNLSYRRGEMAWQGGQHVTFESQEGAIAAQSNGNWVGVFAQGKPLITWEPPLGYEWPLTAGKTWNASHVQTVHATQQRQRLDVVYVVEASETVSVPAGTFETFRVRSTDNLGSENLMWFSPALGIFVKQSLRRTERHPQGPGTREVQLVSQEIRK